MRETEEKLNFKSPTVVIEFNKDGQKISLEALELMFEGTSALKVPSVITLDP